MLSVIVVPMILTSLYLSFSGRMSAHKRVSRWTLPIWLYVSVTGVLIFVLLKLFNTPARALEFADRHERASSRPSSPCC